MKRILPVLFVFIYGVINGQSTDCADCNVIECIGTACDDGSNADGVMLDRDCSCAAIVEGACAKMVIYTNDIEGSDEENPDYYLFAQSQEGGDYNLFLSSDSCQVTDCTTPDHVFSKGGSYFDLPDNRDTIHLIVCRELGKSGRRDFTFYPFVVQEKETRCDDEVDNDLDGDVDNDDEDCSTSSGNDGGMESNGRLALKIADRNLGRLKSNHNGNVQSAQQPFPGNRNKITNRNNPSLTDFIPDASLSGYEIKQSTPEDLLSITNATEVTALDMYKENVRTGVILALKTEEAVYEHTKYICDRLHGGKIYGVEKVEVNGHPFTISKIQNPGAAIEYAASFSIREEGGFVVEQHWNLSDYPQSAYFNFQIWSNSKNNLIQLIHQVLNKAEKIETIKSFNIGNNPGVFAREASFEDGFLKLSIKEKDEDGLKVVVSIQETETSDYLPESDLLPSKRQGNYLLYEVGSIFNVGLSIQSPKNEITDNLFLADGAWGIDGPSSNTINHFQVNADNHDVSTTSDYLVRRNIEVGGITEDHIAIYKAFNPAFSSIDLSAHNTLNFTASGLGTLDVTLVKKSIDNYDDQFTTSIRLDEKPTHFSIHKDQFYRSIDQDFTWEDIQLVVFHLKPTEGLNEVTVDISEVSFGESINQFNPLVGNNEVITFPSPADNHITFQWSMETPVQTTIEIYNIEGKRMETLLHRSIKGINQINLELGDQYHSGIYLYRVSTDEKVLSSGKFMTR